MVKLTLRESESIQEAVRRFRKLVERSGIKKEMRRREYYEKPSEVKRRLASLNAVPAAPARCSCLNAPARRSSSSCPTWTFHRAGPMQGGSACWRPTATASPPQARRAPHHSGKGPRSQGPAAVRQIECLDNPGHRRSGLPKPRPIGGGTSVEPRRLCPQDSIVCGQVPPCSPPRWMPIR